MKRIFAVIALGVALGLSTTSFTPAAAGDDDCETTKDLSVTGVADYNDVGSSELTGKIINQSRSRGYDDVMVRVDFINDNLSNDLLAPGSDDQYDRDMDDMNNDNVVISTDDKDNVVIQSEDHDLTIEGDDIDIDSNSGSLNRGSDVIGSQVFTIKEDVEPGEVESFHLKNVAVPAGTTRIAYSVVCADND